MIDLDYRQPGPAQQRPCATFKILPTLAGGFAFERATADKKYRVLTVVNLRDQTQPFEMPGESASYTDAFAGAGGPITDAFITVPAHGWRVLVAH